MIYASGYVTFLISPTQRVQKRWNRKYFTLTWMGTEQTDQGLKIQYAYKAFLPRSYECRFLEDYTGKVKPFLEKHVKEHVVRLQVVGLEYISEQSIEIVKKMK
ncbi:MAG TPA: hypothetical protein VK120_01840 [Sporosarcina sp.]|nr:hypothetical protein [Sporosarcina sp.]